MDFVNENLIVENENTSNQNIVNEGNIVNEATSSSSIVITDIPMMKGNENSEIVLHPQVPVDERNINSFEVEKQKEGKKAVDPTKKKARINYKTPENKDKLSTAVKAVIDSLGEWSFIY